MALYSWLWSFVYFIFLNNDVCFIHLYIVTFNTEYKHDYSCDDPLHYSQSCCYGKLTSTFLTNENRPKQSRGIKSSVREGIVAAREPRLVEQTNVKAALFRFNSFRMMTHICSGSFKTSIRWSISYKHTFGSDLMLSTSPWCSRYSRVILTTYEVEWY